MQSTILSLYLNPYIVYPSLVILTLYIIYIILSEYNKKTNVKLLLGLLLSITYVVGIFYTISVLRPYNNQLKKIHPTYVCSYSPEGVFCTLPDNKETPDFYSTIGTNGEVGEIIKDDNISFKTTETSVTYSCNKVDLITCYDSILKL